MSRMYRQHLVKNEATGVKRAKAALTPEKINGTKSKGKLSCSFMKQSGSLAFFLMSLPARLIRELDGNFLCANCDAHYNNVGSGLCRCFV